MSFSRYQPSLKTSRISCRSSLQSPLRQSSDPSVTWVSSLFLVHFFYIFFLGLRVVPTLWAWIVSIAASVPNKCLMQLLPLTRWSHLHVLLILGFLCKYPLSYLSIIFSWLFSALHLVLSLHPPCPPLKRSEMSFSVISMPPRDWTSPTWVLQNGKFHSCVQTWHSQSCIIVIIF